MWRPRLIVLQPTPYCNISCDYCYLRNRDNRRLMAPEVILAVRDKIFRKLAPDATPTVVWHAGEPTVAPISWYRHAHAELKSAAPGGARFSIQSNGVSISKDWIDFLLHTGTRVGLSIDGPARFHDSRRKTRSGRGTWSLAMRGLARLQGAGLDPGIITVLHPDCLGSSDEFFDFYKSNGITDVSFSIDEAEGKNAKSSFSGGDYKDAMVEFLCQILRRSFAEEYPLRIREVERIANVLTADGGGENEQVAAWQVIVVAATGDVTTFSPEFMEIRSSRHSNFCFGNILHDSFSDLEQDATVRMVEAEIRIGVERCRADCRYFAVCGGGAPANKMQENNDLSSTETLFCKLSTQVAADALTRFLSESASGRSADMPGKGTESERRWIMRPRARPARLESARDDDFAVRNLS